MQILKAQSRSELADRLRPTIKYKSKAIVAYFVFFITHSLLLIVFLYLFDWVKGQPYQLHWGYFIFSWIYAIAFAFPIKHKFSDYRIPFSFEKYFIDPALVQDLNKLEYIKATATITDIKIPSKQFFKPTLHTLTLQLNETEEVITDTSVHLNLLFRNIYFTNSNYTQFYADPAWIGTRVEVCFLPKSKRIIQLIVDTDQHDFQDLTTESVNKLTLHEVPSRFTQELFAVQSIEAIRSTDNTWQYELIITTTFHNQYHIPANSQGFAKLEQILSNRIDFFKYCQFKQSPSIRSEVLYRPKIIKPPQFLPKIISTPHKVFL